MAKTAPGEHNQTWPKFHPPAAAAAEAQAESRPTRITTGQVTGVQVRRSGRRRSHKLALPNMSQKAPGTNGTPQAAA